MSTHDPMNPAAWKVPAGMTPAEMAEFLEERPTMPDAAWTHEKRRPGEKRDAFVRRVLLGEAAR